MLFQLSPDHLEIRESIHRLAQEKIKPRANEIDEAGVYPMDIKELLAQYGYLGANIPEEYGGAGLDLLSFCLIVEEISRVCASSSQVVVVQELGTLPILIGGSEDLKRRYLPDIASGKKIAAYALTEPNAGSDVQSLQTFARKDGDEYILSGQKVFISNGGVADFYTVFAKTEKGITAFVVDSDTPGLEIGKLEKKMGIKGSPTAQLFFEDCRVSSDNIIGEEGQGWVLAMKTFDKSRPTVGAQALGIAQGALDASLSYIAEREQFGKKIGSFQGVQFMVADMATQIEAARGLVYQAAEKVNELGVEGKNPEVTKASSMAKLFASDVAMKVTIDAVQLLGGYGYTHEYSVERMMRDAKITQIYEGTNQIQRIIIAKNILAGSK
ncbi:acyl-CoA dehydrogenase family protein [Schinkia azotoformans]|uniref:acyl-CoA dehydrogenase family protein n=1 Tax=Schinkia azotoformans TaxID=1454 RepID=UPI002DBA6D69|nr:acyl-CoA dehydrogenase family protein [Schinkia azotoformans]MEC1716980.1 acyl-CoA dehydrogenase family protein [Schinkia azotoformans]MEC1743263.1 acyl-CoA dehydrogenase family protein [Schinkia azotoformans]MEC1744840.1 acyl-CoA dehydrogenase family protein [Schinkia azotoformans]MEC1757020.1 acyl-CoA dehydrogenase family protein [Schinkia azotoformans]MEC1767025.1 acyl-CoA dehydrogenase family protein [Schinkia azotoformans]